MNEEQKRSGPFVPGVRVAQLSQYRAPKEGIVDKVYKTGNFTLVGSKQQYAYVGGKFAHNTKRGGYNTDRLQIWSGVHDREVERYRLLLLEWNQALEVVSKASSKILTADHIERLCALAAELKESK